MERHARLARSILILTASNLRDRRMIKVKRLNKALVSHLLVNVWKVDACRRDRSTVSLGPIVEGQSRLLSSRETQRRGAKQFPIRSSNDRLNCVKDAIFRHSVKPNH